MRKLASIIAAIIAKCQPHNAEKLMVLLPETLRSKFALIYKSRSMQGASTDKPRAIIYGPDAKIIFAFGGGASDTPSNGPVEIIGFNDVTKSFDFYELGFVPGPELSEQSPESCLECHRRKPRPNWESYPDWPGAYGSRDDELGFTQLTRNSEVDPDLVEIEAFRGFLTKNGKQGIYQYLVGLDRLDPQKSSEELAAAFYSRKPNAELSNYLNRRMAERIARELKNAPDFDRYKYALLAQLTGCKSVVEKYLPDSAEFTALRRKGA